MTTINIGKDKIGRKIDFEFELKTDKNGFKEFTMSCNYWNKPHTDIIMGGQCCDEVLKDVKTYVTNPKKVKRMIEVWKEWHLNGMNAGCEHQRSAKWNEVRIDPAELPKSHANRDEKGILAIWVYPSAHFEKGKWIEPSVYAGSDVHEKGLLTKPCPICGYKYGTAWLKREIPAEIINEINLW